MAPINYAGFAKKEGKLNFDSLGNHTSKDISKDIDEFLLGNRHDVLSYFFIRWCS